MARGEIARNTPRGASGLGRVIVWTTGDPANNHQYSQTTAEVLLAWNSGATSHTVTIQTVADDLGRTGNIVETVLAGEIREYGPLPFEGYLQSNGKVNIDVNHAEMKLAVLER